MYAALWRLLIGPAWFKAVQAMILFVLVCLALLTWVFPNLEPTLPFDRIVISET